MGCGASAGPPVPQSPSARYKEEKEEDVFSGKGPKAKAKRKSQKKKAAEAKDIEWHNKNCQDVQFEKVKTVREAYPFDERKRKTVHKRENVRSGGIDDVLKADNWGSVEISDIGPLRLLCDMCGVLLVDIYTNPENPFYVCRNCQRHDRKLELCVRCFTTKAHHQEVEPSPKAKAKGLGRSSTHGGGGKSAPLGRAGTLSMGSDYSSEAAASSSLDDALKSLPSGSWEGQLSEEGGRRHVEYQLRFMKTGVVVGKGPNGCQVEGKFFWNSKTYKPSVEWTETHDWGTLSFCADVDPASKQLDGNFKVSDGGHGTALLKYVPDDTS